MKFASELNIDVFQDYFTTWSALAAEGLGEEILHIVNAESYVRPSNDQLVQMFIALLQDHGLSSTASFMQDLELLTDQGLNWVDLEESEKKEVYITEYVDIKDWEEHFGDTEIVTIAGMDFTPYYPPKQ
jgi:predicted ThiF/HesA family dinucleotide-utilizing enzyme